MSKVRVGEQLRGRVAAVSGGWAWVTLGDDHRIFDSNARLRMSKPVGSWHLVRVTRVGTRDGETEVELVQERGPRVVVGGGR